MKIICVGLNYADHNREMKSESVSKDPIIFFKSDASLLKPGKPFYFPDFSSDMHYEAEIVVKINRLGKNIAEKFAHRYYSDVTIGIDFTARDLQNKLREAGMPWEISKAFDNSAAIGEFVPLIDLNNEIDNLSFRLDINDTTVQNGNTADMIFKTNQIVAYASRFFTLKIGDLIYTGTPSGVGKVKINDHLQGYINGQKLLDLYIK